MDRDSLRKEVVAFLQGEGMPTSWVAFASMNELRNFLIRVRHYPQLWRIKKTLPSAAVRAYVRRQTASGLMSPGRAELALREHPLENYEDTSGAISGAIDRYEMFRRLLADDTSHNKSSGVTESDIEPSSPNAGHARESPSDEVAFPMYAVTVGNGPYPEEDFDSVIEKRNIDPCPLNTEYVDVLVLGRRDWDASSLEAHLSLYRGETLRVYSQEMFLAFLATEQDPYEDPELVLEFRDGHPALEFVIQWGFSWPTTTVVPEGSGDDIAEVSPEDWPNVGLLKYVGYTVGVDGLPAAERRKILDRVFSRPLPNVHSKSYMQEWGEPNSALRLQKLANALSSFARLAKRKKPKRTAAISDWESDLRWLKKKYYDSRFYFFWPRG